MPETPAWDTDENYASYCDFIRSFKLLPSPRDKWVEFNLIMDGVDDKQDEKANEAFLRTLSE